MAYTLNIKCGNLLEEGDATFIVNPSNTRLILGSGVSMAFKRHCGSELQKEMFQKLEKIGHPLQQGDVVVTSSGNAKNFKYALNVAIMDYNAGVRYEQKMPTIKTIEHALKNIENYLAWYESNYREAIKIVLPLMGCGVGGMDKEAVIKLYKQFFERDVSFDCEVVVYGHTQEDYALLKFSLS